MRLAFAFILLVLGGTGVVMYQVGWRHHASSPGSAEIAAPIEAPEFESLQSSPYVKQTSRRAEVRLADAQPSEVWFQYTDERGSVRFASSLEEVPPKWRERAGRVEMSAPIQTIPTRTVTRKPARRPQPAQRRGFWSDDDAGSGNRPSDYSGEVIVYTTSWCGYCKKAIERLDELGVDYVELDIEDDSENEAEFLEKSGGSRGVPLIDVDGQIMRGYSKERLDEMLKLAG